MGELINTKQVVWAATVSMTLSNVSIINAANLAMSNSIYPFTKERLLKVLGSNVCELCQSGTAKLINPWFGVKICMRCSRKTRSASAHLRILDFRCRFYCEHKMIVDCILEDPRVKGALRVSFMNIEYIDNIQASSNGLT